MNQDNMTIEQARTNMIKQQLRPVGVVNETLLKLLCHTPREQFVPSQYKALAFADIDIPLDENHVMPPPKFEAQMIQALQVQSSDTVLEVGTGSGYVTAILAQLASQVYSIDLNPAFSTAAQQSLKTLDIQNVRFETGDTIKGLEAHAPYNIIVIHGSLPQLTDTLLKQLCIGGRMFVVLGQAPAMTATLITRVDEEKWINQALFETLIPPLQAFEDDEPFKF